MPADQTEGGVLVLVGAAMICVAVAFPKFLALLGALPWMRWFLIGPPASRVATIMIGATCILYGLLVAGLIPVQYGGLVFFSCITLMVFAGLHDMAAAKSRRQAMRR